MRSLAIPRRRSEARCKRWEGLTFAETELKLIHLEQIAESTSASTHCRTPRMRLCNPLGGDTRAIPGRAKHPRYESSTAPAVPSATEGDTPPTSHGTSLRSNCSPVEVPIGCAQPERAKLWGVSHDEVPANAAVSYEGSSNVSWKSTSRAMQGTTTIAPCSDKPFEDPSPKRRPSPPMDRFSREYTCSLADLAPIEVRDEDGMLTSL